MHTQPILSRLSKSSLLLATGSILSSLSADVIITEVADGTLTGQQPKFVEITNVGSADYTFPAGSGIIVQSNSATDYNVDWGLDGVVLSPGQSWVVNSLTPTGAMEATFVQLFGKNADQYADVAFANGDDRYILTDGTTFLDIYGEDGVDATPSGGEPAVWAYSDGYAYRKPGITAGRGLAFDPDEWVYGGADSLEADTEEDAIALAQAVLTPGTYGAAADPTWGGLPIVDIDGSDWVDTGSWLGWIALLGGDWVWSDSLGIFLYAPDPGSDPVTGIWVYALRVST